MVGGVKYGKAYTGFAVKIHPFANQIRPFADQIFPQKCFINLCNKNNSNVKLLLKLSILLHVFNNKRNTYLTSEILFSYV